VADEVHLETWSSWRRPVVRVAAVKRRCAVERGVTVIPQWCTTHWMLVLRSQYSALAEYSAGWLTRLSRFVPAPAVCLPAQLHTPRTGNSKGRERCRHCGYGCTKMTCSWWVRCT